jgi:hypothetical protein
LHRISDISGLDSKSAPLLVIACGAIARELVRIQKLNQWNHIEFQCLPAKLHNTPERITGAVEARIESERENYDRIFVAYADCGTGGSLDLVLDRYGVERLPGAHCYEFYSGSKTFERLSSEDPGTFFLTDFLVHSFDRLVKKGLGLDRLPELIPEYFGNYHRIVYLAQTDSASLQSMAREHANYLGLAYQHVYCGLDPLAQALELRLT